MIEVGAVLSGRYKVERILGQGGMGNVYLAVDSNLDSYVAIKENLFEDEKLQMAFRKEAKLLANLLHPALPRVIDHFVEANGQFLVMEYIPGPDLYELLIQRGSPFAIDELIDWSIEILDALTYLHTQGIIHRDVKPKNLKRTPGGQIYLLDFGLAKGRPRDGEMSSGKSSMHGYTPGYSSIEQFLEYGTDARSDLYSLAATLYHLATGEHPAGVDRRAMANQRGEKDPLEPPRSLNEAIPEPFSALLVNVLCMDREGRPRTARIMQGRLKELQRFQWSTIPNDSGLAPTKTAEKPEPAAEPKLDQSQGVEESAPVPSTPDAASTDENIVRGAGNGQTAPMVSTPRAANGLSVAAEFMVAAADAWPLRMEKVLVLERADSGLALWDTNGLTWRSSAPPLIRLVSMGLGAHVAAGGWTGQVHIFVDGAFSQMVDLGGTVGDLQFCNGRWIAGSWRHALLSIEPKGAYTRLLDVELGVLRIAVMPRSDRFAIVDLGGGISLYSSGIRVVTVPSLGKVRSIAFAGSRLAALLDDSLVLIDWNGKCTAPDDRPEFRDARLVPSPIAGSCLLLCRDGSSYRIDQSGKHLRDIALSPGAAIISGCSLPWRCTVRLAAGGCAYWRDGREVCAWPEGVMARLSHEGTLVAVAFQDKVSVFEDPA